MILYLIRHAESENNARDPTLRVEDPGITQLGRQQANCLAQWAAKQSFDRLITSPFLRTLQTTAAVVHQKPQRVFIWHNVFERGGCYRGYFPEDLEGASGMGRSEIASQLPDAEIDSSITESGWWGERTPETDQQAEKRAEEVVARLLSGFGNSDVAIALITHADLKRLMLKSMLSGQVDAAKLGPLRNTGVTRLNFIQGAWQLDWFNSVTHLSSDHVTGNES